VDWKVSFEGYTPVAFTHDVVKANDETKKRGGWADPQDHTVIVGLDKRLSYETPHFILDQKGLPRNPQGRTGIVGRGLLGKYGPNHAADPIVTRVQNGRRQMVAIKRKDTGEWAIPGGMVDPGETFSVTLRREFEEEAGNVPASQQPAMKKNLDDLFRKGSGKTIYKGYVDDPRNTDNAWMETVVVHFPCSKELGDMLSLHAGDDAAEVKWLDIDDSVADYKNLYASHKAFVDACFKEGEDKEDKDEEEDD